MLPKGLLKEYSHALALGIGLTDAFVMFAASWVAYVVRFDSLSMTMPYLSAALVGALLTPFVFSSRRIYASVRGEHFFQHVLRLFQSIVLLAFFLAGLSFFAKLGVMYSRTWFACWMFFSLIALAGYRQFLIAILRLMRTKGFNERNVVIFGVSKMGEQFATTVQQALWTGFKIVAFIDDNAESKPETVHKIPVIQTPAQLSTYLEENKIDEIWLALPLRAENRVKQILHDLRHHTIATRLLLDIFSLDLLNHSIGELAGFPVLNICSSPMRGINRIVKAIEDKILSSIIIFLISPILIIIAIAVKLSSPGPIFYRQKRIGWNGKEFEMLKFRTMPINAESSTGPVWASKGDGRATRVGKFLRKTSLDELPQFFNVLKGDMSIVGPRPERKVFVDEFKEKIPRYMQKHFVKAGITGWAQANGWRGNTSLAKRIEFDLYYIEHWSLLFDIKIIFMTIFRGFIHRNAY